LYIDEGKLDKAQANFTQSLRLNPKDTVTHVNRKRWRASKWESFGGVSSLVAQRQ
jgi:hypothetical protein